MQKLSDILVEEGLLSAADIEEVTRQRSHVKERLFDTLLRMECLPEETILTAMERHGWPRIRLEETKIQPEALALLSDTEAIQNQALPVQVEGNRLFVAMADPFDVYAQDTLRILTGKTVVPMLASQRELKTLIARYYEVIQQTEEITETNEALDANSPVGKMVNQMLTQAASMRASDVHFDPTERGMAIRFRVDGLLHTDRELPRHLKNVLITRIKVMAELNIAERRLPQDGRFLSDPIVKSKWFPPMVAHLLAIGEETGNMETMAEKIADFYETEVDEMSDRLKTLIEPLMMIILGAVVGTIVMAVIAPEFSLYQHLG